MASWLLFVLNLFELIARYTDPGPPMEFDSWVQYWRGTFWVSIAIAAIALIYVLSRHRGLTSLRVSEDVRKMPRPFLHGLLGVWLLTAVWIIIVYLFPVFFTPKFKYIGVAIWSWGGTSLWSTIIFTLSFHIWVRFAVMLRRPAARYRCINLQSLLPQRWRK